MSRTPVYSPEVHKSIVQGVRNGLKPPEAGKRCGISPRTVESWLRQARLFLFQHIDNNQSIDDYIQSIDTLLDNDLSKNTSLIPSTSIIKPRDVSYNKCYDINIYSYLRLLRDIEKASADVEYDLVSKAVSNAMGSKNAIQQIVVLSRLFPERYSEHVQQHRTNDSNHTLEILWGELRKPDDQPMIEGEYKEIEAERN